MVWLDGPRKGKADQKGVRHDLPTMRQRMLLAGEEAEEVVYPAGSEFLWRSFWQLHKRRGSNGYSANALSWREVRAWEQTMLYDLLPWEARAIMEMDEAYMTARDELDDDTPKMGKRPDNSEIMSVFAAASAGKKKAVG